MITSRRTFCAQDGALVAAADRALAAGLDLQKATWKVVAVDPNAPGTGDLKVSRDWKGDLCRTKLVNSGKDAVRVKEVVLFAIAHNLPADTHLYGESFQMLSHTAGTLGKPVDLGYSERTHYKLQQP